MDQDDALDTGVRIGLVSYGVVHLLIAWLCLQLVFGDREGKMSGSGALRQLAETDLGRISLFVVAFGLAQVLGVGTTQVCPDCGRRLDVKYEL